MKLSGNLHAPVALAGQNASYPSSKRMSGLRNSRGFYGVEKNILLLNGVQSSIIQPTALSLYQPSLRMQGLT